MHRTILVSLLATMAVFLTSASAGASTDTEPNPAAVQEVLDGKREVANAAWWGFDQDDSTEALQAAIDSGATKVIVPNMEQDWIVRPLTLASNQELVLEEGVVITAKRGEYRGGGDSVFTAQNAENLILRGYGATVRMYKEDYIVGLVLKDYGWHRWYGQYEKAEWRSTLMIRGCTNMKVLGVSLRESGGDGILVGGGGGKTHSTNIEIRDVVCDNHYRQGISVISVDGLLVENSAFKNTWGTPPSSGVDIEPDSAEELVKNVVFRNCRFEDNYGDGIEIFLSHQTAKSEPISILFKDCYVTSRRGQGIRVSKVVDDGPAGLIEFRNCKVENTEAYGIKVQDKSADAARVRFVDCTLKNVANNPNYRGAFAPIWLHPYRPMRVARFGGIDFVNCRVEDDRDRPVITVTEEHRDQTLHDVTGLIRFKSESKMPVTFGPKSETVTLRVVRRAD